MTIAWTSVVTLTLGVAGGLLLHDLVKYLAKKFK